LDVSLRWKVRACNSEMPDSSLFEACLLKPGNLFKYNPPDHAHEDRARTHRIQHSANISNIACARLPHYATGQFSSLRRNRGPAADRGAPRLRLQTDRCSGRTRGRSVLHPASCSFTELGANQLPSIIQVASLYVPFTPYLRPLLFASPQIPSLPLNDNASPHQASPRDCCDIRALVA
jgi:hypothetical protein